MKQNIRIIFLVAGALAGAISGFLYWKWVGCATGTCMITSRPLNSTLYFAVMGILVVNIFLPSRGNDQKTAN